MKKLAASILVAMLIAFPPVLAFTRIESMPYSIVDRNGPTLFWNNSYLITVDDMEIRIVLGPAHVTYGRGSTVINWDPEIISIIVEGDDVMRREAFISGIENDPISKMPFVGIGSLVSPHNLPGGIEPLDPPPTTFEWIQEGENGMISWVASNEYSPGDQILWLNRTYRLNASLGVEAKYWVASEYQAIQQRITVTNGDVKQLLPFPLETAFTIGSTLVGRGISLPDMSLKPDRYYTYPSKGLPQKWYNDSSGYEIPSIMWEEKDLPGMLYLEFDLENGRDWYGMSAESALSRELMTGVGAKVLSTKGMPGFRPYCMLFSGPQDHIIMGFKPYEEAGAYDDFVPMKLEAGQEVSLDVLWFFPEPVEGEMSTSILGEFGELAISVSEFQSRRSEAKRLFESANQLAGQGEINGAVDKVNQSIEVLKPLGELSSVLEEEIRTINATKNTWIAANADPPPHPESEGRPAMIYAMMTIIILIIALATYIYLVEPRLSTRGE